MKRKKKGVIIVDCNHRVPCQQPCMSERPKPCGPAMTCKSVVPNLQPVDSMMLAMSYVPWQQWGEVYDIQKAYRQGTIFPVLDKPFCRGGCSV